MITISLQSSCHQYIIMLLTHLTPPQCCICAFRLPLHATERSLGHCLFDGPTDEILAGASHLMQGAVGS